MKNDIKAFIPISKVDKEKRMVYGYCSTEIEDSQGEIVEHMAIINAWPDYMRFANVREMHQPSAVGITKEAMDDNHGKWIGVKVVDDNAWNKVKEEVYKGFSIGGKVTKMEGNRIKELQLYEISLVDRPANEEAVFEVAKFVNGKVVDKSIQEVNIAFNKLEKTMSKIKKDVVGEIPTPEVKTEEEIAAEVKATEDAKAIEDAKKAEDEKAIAEAKAIEDAKTDEGKEADKKAEEEKKALEAKAIEEAKVKDEKAVMPEAKKGVSEVGMLADLARNCGMVLNYSDKEAKYTDRVKNAMKELLLACGEEAGRSAEDPMNDTQEEKAVVTDGLSKTVIAKLGSIQQEVEKFAESVSKVATLEKTVTELKEKLEKVEGQPKADRPVATFAIEKGFAGEDVSKKKVEQLKKELAEIELQITANHDMAKSFVGDTLGSEKCRAKTEELSKAYFQKRAEVREASAMMF